MKKLMQIAELGPGLPNIQSAKQIEIKIKYSGYIDRQQEEIAKHLRQESLKVPENMDYNHIIGLSSEVRQKNCMK